MTIINDILIDEDIFATKFCCDIEKCKGACCTFPGEYGAPLLESEIQLLEDNYPKIKKYLSDRSIYYIENQGMYEGRAGYRTTVCINKRDCVFVYYEGEVALCAYEKAYLAGEIDFRKPLSCHLFPIRVKKFGGDALYYCQIDECNDAVEKGENENILMIDSLKTALVRAYGEQWYDTVKQYLESAKDEKEF